MDHKILGENPSGVFLFSMNTEVLIVLMVIKIQFLKSELIINLAAYQTEILFNLTLNKI